MGKVTVVRNSQTKRRVITLVITALATFLFASLAIDRGLIWYFPFFLSMFFGIRAVVQLIKKQ